MESKWYNDLGNRPGERLVYKYSFIRLKTDFLCPPNLTLQQRPLINQPSPQVEILVIASHVGLEPGNRRTGNLILLDLLLLAIPSLSAPRLLRLLVYFFVVKLTRTKRTQVRASYVP